MYNKVYDNKLYGKPVVHNAENKSIITVYISDRHLDLFQLLIDKGLVPSRSEAVRWCIRKALPMIIKEDTVIMEMLKQDKTNVVIDDRTYNCRRLE